MHSDQTQIDPGALAQAVYVTAPELGHLPLTRLNTGGTENHIFRLGETHSIRLPQRPAFAEVLEKEARWLPQITPHLPLKTTDITHRGRLGELPFLIQTWVPGTDAAAHPPSDLLNTADTLATFLTALHALPVQPEAPTGSRGGPLAPQDPRFQEALLQCSALTDTQTAAQIWQMGLDTPPYDGPPRWLHGDLTPANLITQDGRLTGVIDWGCLYAGDPAYDLIPAWFLLDPPARSRLKALLQPDEATWTRARARVVWQSIVALPYYLDTNPTMVHLARQGLAAAFEEDT